MIPTFGSMTIEVVENGTEIEFNGEKLIVDDNSCVVKHGKIYVTQKTAMAIKQRIPDLARQH